MKKIKSKIGLILYGCSGMGVNLLNMIVGSYLCSALLVGGFAPEDIGFWTYVDKDLVVGWLWAILMVVAKVIDGIIDLPMSTFADRLKTKFGRRKTAILMGILPMICSFLLFLVPLQPHEGILNTIWFGVLLCIYYASYTLTMLTYYATFSEVCETEKETLFLSNTKSICDIVYMSLSFALVPLFVSMKINIRYVALMFLPFVATMIIPFFLLKENKEDGEEENQAPPLTLGKSLAASFKNKTYIYWLCTAFVMALGLQLFLGGINELFSTTGLNMTVVMASAFAPVPFTLIVYNKIIKKFGFANALRYALSIFIVGMGIMCVCNLCSPYLTNIQLNTVAICGGIFVSFALGAFFWVSYAIPSFLARREMEKHNRDVSSMYFAVLGLFEGVAAGIATGPILVALKEYNVVALLPIISAICCIAAFGMTFGFQKELRFMGKEVKAEKSAQEVPMSEVNEK